MKPKSLGMVEDREEPEVFIPDHVSLEYPAAPVEPVSDIEAEMENRLGAVRALTALGRERQTIAAQLAICDGRIAEAAAEAAAAGLTWNEIFKALKAKVDNPEEDLLTDSQIYTRARKTKAIE